jgi:hypothetical protein
MTASGKQHGDGERKRSERVTELVVSITAGTPLLSKAERQRYEARKERIAAVKRLSGYRSERV